MKERRPASERLAYRWVKPPFREGAGGKGWLTPFTRAQQHVVHRLPLTIDGWPKFSRPLRIAFLSDFHIGSHADDLTRLAAILDEAATFTPDLVLYGGDYVNMQMFGGGRIPPHVIAALLARLDGACGRFAVLGNHDYNYGDDDVSEALRGRGITVIDHERRTVTYEGRPIDVLGLPDAHIVRPQARDLVATLSPDRPAIVLAHDPAWFLDIAAGPYLTLSGHTHGGQIRLPFLGILKNSSRAPLHWSHGHVVDRGRQLYVSAGLGTSTVPIRVGVRPEFAVLDVNGT